MFGRVAVGVAAVTFVAAVAFTAAAIDAPAPSRVASRPTASPLPTADPRVLREAATLAGYKRISSPLGGWSMEIPAAWHATAARVRGAEIATFDVSAAQLSGNAPATDQLRMSVTLEPVQGGRTLEQLGMEQRTFSAPLEEMSRGMQQKISIARASMINPPLLLLDEPTTGLDPKSRRDVQAFLEDLRRREGTTILLTTHDMAEAERLCARIGFLAHGRLVAEGTAEGLRRQASAATLDDAFIGLTEETAAAGDTPTGAPTDR